jgi:hypothetical protein
VGPGGAQPLGLGLGLGRRRDRPLLTRPGRALVALSVTIAVALAVGAAPAAVAPLAAVTAVAAAPIATALVAAAGSLAPRRAGQAGGDQRALGAGRQQVDALGLGPGRLGRHDADHAQAVEEPLDLDLHHIAHLHCRRHERSVERPLGLARTGGAPRPGAVVALARELDLHPPGHRDPTLARPLPGGLTRVVAASVGWR